MGANGSHQEQIIFWGGGVFRELTTKATGSRARGEHGTEEHGAEWQGDVFPVHVSNSIMDALMCQPNEPEQTIRPHDAA
jgi:hypothetical protein